VDTWLPILAAIALAATLLTIVLRPGRKWVVLAIGLAGIACWLVVGIGQDKVEGEPLTASETVAIAAVLYGVWLVGSAIGYLIARTRSQQREKV
jgi:hypothetical protein